MVPSELKQLPQWVVWRLEERNGKATKVPYRADGAGMAAVNAPESWAPMRLAYDAWQADGFNGLGFVLTRDDPYCGLDLDHCVDAETGAIAAWADAIVDRFSSYTEVTPSNTGLRIWIRGVLHGERNRKGSIELYDHDRYFTMTGRQLEDTPPTIEERQAELDAFYLELFPPAPERPAAAGGGLSVYQVLDKAKAAKNGPKFDRLMRGDAGEYSSGSEADLALVSLIAFYSQQPVVIEQIVRMSGLWDDKWERADYRERTINRALEQLTETYSANGSAGGEIRGSAFAPADEAAKSEPIEAQPWLTPLGSWLDGPAEDLDWLIEGMLIRGGVGVMGAKPKVGKTTLQHQLAVAIARGEKFLERSTRSGPVIYLALEEDRGRVIERFRKLGARSNDPVHLLVGQAGPEGLLKLGAAIRELNAVLAIIDPIQRLTRLENINDYSEVSNATDPLIALARQTGCAILFSHHLGKMERESGDQLLGSTALFGSVDTSIVMRKVEGSQSRTLETIQRYGTSLEPKVLGFNPDTGAAWIQGPVEEYERDRDRVSVLTIICEQLEPITQSELQQLMPVRWDRVVRALGSLVEEHSVQRFGGGVRGNPFKYLALRKPEELTTAFLNSNPFSSALGSESGRESSSLYSEIDPTKALPPIGSRGKSFLPPFPLTVVSEVPEPLAAGRRRGCPLCGGLPYLAGPDGPPQRRCHSCDHVWTPEPSQPRGASQ